MKSTWKSFLLSLFLVAYCVGSFVCGIDLDSRDSPDHCVWNADAHSTSTSSDEGRNGTLSGVRAGQFHGQWCIDWNHSHVRRGELLFGTEPAFLCDVSQCSDNCGHLEGYSEICLCFNEQADLAGGRSLYSSLLVFHSFGVFLLLVALPVIILFNLNVVAGPSLSFVFFYQSLPLASPSGKLWSLIVLQNQLYDAPPYVCEFGPHRNLVAHYYFLEYFKYVITVVVLLLVVFLIKCSDCPLQKCRLPWAKMRRAVRNFREKHTAKRTILHGISSCLVLAYGDLVAITSNILSEGVHKCCLSREDMCPQQCPDSNTFVTRFIPAFFGFACFVLFFLLLPPLLLIYYPLIPSLCYKLTKRSLPQFSKLHPWFDVFQGVYKDKHRWYAGLHFLYLIFLWAVYAYAEANFDINRRSVALTFSFIIILGVHSSLQPYKEPNHNYYACLYLVYLVLASSSTQAYYFLLQFKTAATSEDYAFFYWIVSFLAIWVMGSLPLVTVIVVCICNLFRKYRICRHCTHSICPPKVDRIDDADEEFLSEQLPYRLAT